MSNIRTGTRSTQTGKDRGKQTYRQTEIDGDRQTISSVP